ncbi:MAG: methionine--tRNA ligase [Chitinispirillaceae bacterium]|nr:methionine--tRNA ligase [Chitinispirillaceae bacterium]
MYRNNKKFLVTMALPYANGDIHLGHLLEAIQTDTYVRFQRLNGNEVVYVCADDTHGTPIELSALRQKITPEELIAKVYERHIKDYEAFNIGFDIFYTTNSSENRKLAVYFYNNLKKNNLIIEKEIEQYYCEKDKRFLPDRFIVGICPKCKAEKQYGDVCEVCGATYNPSELIEPHCIICDSIPVMKKSTHLYVQLNKCEDFLREYVNRNDVLQEEMKNYVLSWINEGLKEWCISRDGPYFGFEIPDKKNKFFYVWLDAPIGYVSSTEKWCKEHNRTLEEFWGENSDTKIIHFIGKDIVYFHTLFWPVMLKSSSFNLPSKFFIHGFITVEGEKMSKTRGTFILAKDFIEKVKHPMAVDFLRFYYCSKLTSGSGDIDFSTEEFVTRCNTALVNNIGNLHHRTLVFCERYFENMVPNAPWDETIAKEVEKYGFEIASLFDKGEYKTAIEKILVLGNIGNKYYQDSKPWELIKSAPEKAASVMVTCINLIKALGVFLSPVTPQISNRLASSLDISISSWDQYLFSLRNVKLGNVEKLVQQIEKSTFEPLITIKKESNNSDKKENKELDKTIDLETFQKVNLKVGTVIAAEPITNSTKLLKLQVDLGDEKRQVIAGIAKSYKPEDIMGCQVVIVANLKAAKICGEKSEGMILAAADKDGTLRIITPQTKIQNGATVG